MADRASAHLWWIEVGTTGRFRIVYFDPSGSHRLSVWGPGGAELAGSEAATAASAIDVVAAETGLYVLSLSGTPDSAAAAPYLIVAVWEGADAAPVRGPAGRPPSPVAAPPERPEVAPARVAGLSAGRAPAAPSRLRAALTDSGDIRLDWRDNSDDETGFRIASSDESDPILVEANRVVHRAQLPAGDSNCFRVQAFNDFGGSSWSREACAGASQAGFAPSAAAPMMLPPIAGAPLLPPNPPRGLRARPINHNTIQLDWTDTSDNEMGFYIDGTGGFFTLGRNTTTTRVGGLLPMTSYCFRVFAVSDGGQSGTNEACATTPPPPPF